MPKKICFFSVFIFFSLFHLPVYSAEKLEELFAKGIQLFQEKNLKGSEACFKKIVKKELNNYACLFNLGLISLKTGDYKKSKEYLEKAKQLNPFDLRLDQMLSCLFLLTKQKNLALQYLSAIIFKKPQDISSHKKLGLTYLQENKTTEAIAEFILLKNSANQDKTSVLLLSIGYSQTADWLKAGEELLAIKNLLAENEELAYLAWVLQKNNQNDEAKKIYPSTITQDPIPDLINNLQAKLIETELNEIALENEFTNSEIIQRNLEKTKQETIQQIPSLTQTQTQSVNPRPLNYKGTFSETIEFYKRKPLTTSPINGMNTTSNLKLEGRTKNNTAVSTQLEWFNNRWDHTVLDYYKINASQSNDFEIDLGKFSPKRFPTLVSHPTIIDGIHVWKKFNLPAFTPDQIQLRENSAEPLNLGELYRQANKDTRLFKTSEITFATGRTLDHLNLNERKQKNENTYETSGQYEQLTTGLRGYSQVTPYMEMGVSLTQTYDRPYSAETSATTYPIKSEAIGTDGGIDLFDNKVNFDWEFAMNKYDTNQKNKDEKEKRDHAYLWKLKYNPTNEFNTSYEQKFIGNNYKVEGAYQTEDKLSRTLSAEYKPAQPKTWNISSLTLKFQPEETNPAGTGENLKKYKTFQPVLSLKLPQDAKLNFDYKYYREYDKCSCSNYRTRTLKQELEWEIKPAKTTIKPAFTFERKDDRISAATDEKSKKYTLVIENTAVTNLTLKFSIDGERKKYIGYTNKYYSQYTYAYETKYTFIPSRLDATLKYGHDSKHPTDTNKTKLDTMSINLNYTSQSGDDKITLSYERKNNIYEPWSETSAYRQNYLKMKIDHKF
jgi:tetratricopeptide (TPR) repeat protein